MQNCQVFAVRLQKVSKSMAFCCALASYSLEKLFLCNLVASKRDRMRAVPDIVMLCTVSPGKKAERKQGINKVI
jgi:hypothetical protein